MNEPEKIRIRRQRFEEHCMQQGLSGQSLEKWGDTGDVPPKSRGSYVLRHIQQGWLAFQAGCDCNQARTRDGVVVEPGDKVWVNGSVSVEPTTVQPTEALTSYELFGRIPVSQAFSTEAAARAHRYER